MGAIRSKSGQTHRKGEEPDNVPGIQKIKSLIRQTTRLLSKEKLDARVRVESERRLKVLQEDLEKAQLKRKVRTNASRYQKIKLIEKTKTTHRITRTKRQLKDPTLDAKTRSQLEESLFEQRVNLNYTIHFPGLKKYVSLYKLNEDAVEGASKSTSSTHATREEVRSWVSKSMKNGELPAEPELDLGSHMNVGTEQYPRDNEGDDTTSNRRSTKQSTSKSKLRAWKGSGASAPNLTLAGDDFFGEED